MISINKVLSKNDINPGVTVDSQKEIMDNSEFLPCCSFSSSTPEVLSVKSIRKRTVSENKSKRTKSSGIFAGFVIYVDYKSDMDPTNMNIKENISDLGAEIAKRFNLKVTHVVFYEGSRTTFKTAKKRKIPLVSYGWILNSLIAKQVKNPADYPPIDLDKYENPLYVPKFECKYENFRRMNQTLEGMHKHFMKRFICSETSGTPNSIVEYIKAKESSQANTLQSNTDLSSNQHQGYNIIDDLLKDLPTLPETKVHKCGPGVAFTGFTFGLEKYYKMLMIKLGICTFHNKVQSNTIYLVVSSNPPKEPDLTLNMEFAIAFGCYIVTEKWIEDSEPGGILLPHQNYLKVDLADPVKEFQLKRNSKYKLKPKFKIFDDANNASNSPSSVIYVSRRCEYPANDLKRLIRACGGECTDHKNLATIVVGEKFEINKYLDEKWILDCVTQGKMLPVDDYIMTLNE